jgi:putative transposase
MKTSKHSESEIIKALKQLESGITSDIVARDIGVSRATLYQWKKKYDGLDASQLKRLKELEAENARLKQMYADLALDNKILKEVIEKKL